jgi:nanoRNase/pAp phosphatase (c-di-AMP/oligoRNAs hydrolase)
LTTADVDLESLRRLLRGRILLLCHHNADPDSVCAAHAFKELVAALDPEVEADIVLTDGASRLSWRIMEKLGIAVGEVSPSDHADTLVTLDTATLSQLADWGGAVASSEAPRVFIDHHSPHPEIRSIASVFIVDEAASSTCEIVHGLFEGYGLSPSRGVADALLVGMVFDSRHFTIGTARTFRSVSRLLEVGSPLEEIFALLVPERDRSESIARLKAAQRMQLHAIEGWTIATSHVSSYQASAARALLRLGADAVVVAGADRGELRASMRSTEEFYNETRIHLGRDIAQPLGEEYGGAGSGHSTAAGVNGMGMWRAMLLRAVELISEKLNN